MMIIRTITAITTLLLTACGASDRLTAQLADDQSQCAESRWDLDAQIDIASCECLDETKEVVRRWNFRLGGDNIRFTLAPSAEQVLIVRERGVVSDIRVRENHTFVEVERCDTDTIDNLIGRTLGVCKDDLAQR